jgi:heat shock protein HslJ
MKLRAKLAALLAASAALAMGACATGGAPQEAAPPEIESADFSGALGRDWVLSEIRRGADAVAVDRERAAQEMGYDAVFTLRFEQGRFSGRAAPNLYFGPFALGHDRAITFGFDDDTDSVPVFGMTLMAALEPEPGEISEHEFLVYISNAFMWDLAGEELRLHTTAEDGSEAVLVFVLL